VLESRHAVLNRMSAPVYPETVVQKVTDFQ